MVDWILRFTFVPSYNFSKRIEKGQKGMNSDREKKPDGMGDNNSYIICIEQENGGLFSGALGVILKNSEIK